MGTFTKLPDETPKSTHHRRTFVCEVTVNTSDLDKIIDVMKNAPHWSGTELSRSGNSSRIMLRYGPVFGAYKSDVVRFLTRNVGITYDALKEGNHECADDCPQQH